MVATRFATALGQFHVRKLIDGGIPAAFSRSLRFSFPVWMLSPRSLLMSGPPPEPPSEANGRDGQRPVGFAGRHGTSLDGQSWQQLPLVLVHYRRVPSLSQAARGALEFACTGTLPTVRACALSGGDGTSPTTDIHAGIMVREAPAAATSRNRCALHAMVVPLHPNPKGTPPSFYLQCVAVAMSSRPRSKNLTACPREKTGDVMRCGEFGWWPMSRQRTACRQSFVRH